MPSNSATARLKSLAEEALDAVVANSAGEDSRGVNWSFVVEGLPRNHTLVELAPECFAAMSPVQRREFLGLCDLR